jgi:hypothetical protein
MRLQKFQVSLVASVRQQLPRALRDPQLRAFASLLKLYYANPKVHYEIWVRGETRLIEIGLHFEADKHTNDALRAYFEKRALEIRAELGERVEVERWTNVWSRVHQVLPYETLDEELVEQVAEKLARMITVLEPMVQQWRKNQ